VARLKAEGLGGSAIAKRLGIGRASVYHILEDKKPEHSLAIQPVVETSPR
jgi:transposase